MKPVKVGFLIPQIHMAGPERFLLGLLRHADPTRVEFTGVALCPWSMEVTSLCRDISKYAPIHGCQPMYPDQPVHDYSFVKRSHDIYAASQHALSDADVIIAWGTKKNLPIWLGAEAWRSKKIIFLAHGNRSYDNTYGHEVGATHFAAVSTQATRFYAPDVRDKVKVIHNGVETERCAPIVGRFTMREALGFTEEQFVLGYLGWMEEGKNPQSVAVAVKSLQNDGPEVVSAQVRGLFVGAGDISDKIVNMFADQPELAVFSPSVEHVGDVLAVMDTLVMPSHEDAFSLVIAEGMIAGVPVIATPVGVVEDLKRLYADAGDFVVEVPFQPTAEDMVAAVKRVWADGLEISDTARRIAWEYLTASAMSHRWMQYIEEVAR